jgi:hypothetical protein
MTNKPSTDHAEIAAVLETLESLDNVAIQNVSSDLGVDGYASATIQVKIKTVRGEE